VPVVDGDGRPVGMISSGDFLQYIVDELESLIEKANRELRHEELTDPFSIVGAEPGSQEIAGKKTSRESPSTSSVRGQSLRQFQQGSR
jgi:hypothetical protein